MTSVILGGDFDPMAFRRQEEREPMTDRAIISTWRVGRKVGRTIYAQSGSEPSDADQLIGVMDTPSLARAAITAANGDAGLKEEVERLRSVIAELVRLKDGPRDDAYRASRDAAWQAARESLASVERDKT